MSIFDEVKLYLKPCSSNTPNSFLYANQWWTIDDPIGLFNLLGIEQFLNTLDDIEEYKKDLKEEIDHSESLEKKLDDLESKYDDSIRNIRNITRKINIEDLLKEKSEKEVIIKLDEALTEIHGITLDY